MLKIKVLVLFFLVVGANCFGQQPLTCVVNGGVNPPAEAQGLTELVGDFLVTCTGGTPTAVGVAIPTVTIQIFLNTQVTSRCLESTTSVGCLGLHSEAMLILDDPAPATQFGCPTNTCVNAGNGTGAAIYGPATQGNGTQGSPYTPGANKNVFQGIQTAANSITFLAVPIDPPGNGPGAVRVVRITNVRANANGLGVASGNNAPTSITETITSTPFNFMPVSGIATQAVGSVQLGMTTSVVGAPTFQQSQAQNPSLANDPNSPGVSQFSLRFRELFSTAFKKRNIATSALDPTALADQSDLTVGSYNSTSGFYNSSLTLPFASQNGAKAGLTDSGTRLMARFAQVPPGVSLFAAVSGTVTGGGAGAVRMVNTDASGAGVTSPVTGNAFGIAPIPLVDGVGMAVFEVVESDPNSFATVDLPIFVAYQPFTPGLGTAIVQLSYAPTSTTTAATFALVPRFADYFPTFLDAFTIEAPHCATIATLTASFGAAGGLGSSAVTTDPGCQWAVSSPSTWITVLPSGPNLTSLNYTVAPNSSPSSRVGVVLLHFVGQPTMPDRAVTVTQDGLTCAYTVSPSTVVPYTGGAGQFMVTANSPLCPWTATINGQSPAGPAFFFLTSQNSGFGNGTVDYFVTAHIGDVRVAFLTIAGQGISVIQAGQHIPAPVSVSSISGSGATHSFVFTFSDVDGGQDLGVVNVLINRFLDGRNACYLAYDRPGNVLYLVGDSGGGLTGLALNGSGSVSNSQCTVNGAGSSASVGVNTLTLTLAIAFNQSNFAGEKVTYLAARDSVLNNSGWRTMGVWSVPPLTPVFPSVLSVTPSSGGGPSQQFTLIYRDAASSANLRTAQLLINADLNGNLACYLGYDHTNNVLYLVNDANTGLLLPGIVPNSGSGAVQNSQCTLNGAGTTKSESLTDLTLTINLTFKPGFFGPKVVYSGVQTISNANSDWRAVGFWNVP